LKRILRIGLWAGCYWFCGAWWLARYLDVDQLHLIATDAVIWAFVCVIVETTRLEVVHG